MSRKYTLPPNPGRLIEGLRDTGYNFNTALADIIDNSVDAGATSIDVTIKMDVDGEVMISVADNGSGMNEAALMNGMTYGAVGQPDPKRLGKFGLGLKTASTAFCRRLSVVSRAETSSEFLKVIWDLDHVVNVEEWELQGEDPTQYELDLLHGVAEDGIGTLVVWEKVDRLMKEYSDPGGKYARKALENVETKFRDHIAMVYQRFLDPQDDRAHTINIKLNDQPVDAWNPFCQSEEETETVGSESPLAELPDGSKATFGIRAFVLPRAEHFSSEEAHKKARLTNDMQGIYIYRENRLIQPANWLGMFSKEPHLTLLRVEFSFDHELDDAFQVDIKKSEIRLNDDLYGWVLKKFLPAPRNAANGRYRKGQRKRVAEKSENAHNGSNRSISEKESDLLRSDIDVIDAGENKVRVKNKSGHVELKIKVGHAVRPGEVCVAPVESIHDGLLWQPALIDGHHAVEINTSHEYYSKVYVPNLASGVTIQGMDSLLWALTEAELGTVNSATREHFEEMRFELSRLLRKLVEDLPDPDLSEDE
ncbi:MAG: ATP-binding protein [Candidatus Latescibacterota bacterium]|nr:ATP-binding protein [Candidatus Latescibacterota bacterium]